MLTHLELSPATKLRQGTEQIGIERDGREQTLVLPVGREGETANVNFFRKPNSAFEEIKIDIHDPRERFLVRATPETAAIVEPYGLYGYLVAARSVVRNSENSAIRQRFLDVSSLIHTAIIEPNLGFQPLDTWVSEYTDDINKERVCLRLERGLIVADIPVWEGKGQVAIYSFNQQENGLPAPRLGARADEFGDLNNLLFLDFDLDREGNIVIDKKSGQFIDTFYEVEDATRQFPAEDDGYVQKVNLKRGTGVSLTSALNTYGGGIKLMHDLAQQSLQAKETPNRVTDTRKKLMLELEFALRNAISANS